MAKSQTQRTREHVARLRRKAQAFDKLIAELQFLSKYFFDTDRFVEKSMVDSAIEDAQEAIQEASA
jgi:hypothetical protein